MLVKKQALLILWVRNTKGAKLGKKIEESYFAIPISHLQLSVGLLPSDQFFNELIQLINCQIWSGIQLDTFERRAHFLIWWIFWTHVFTVHSVFNISESFLNCCFIWMRLFWFWVERVFSQISPKTRSITDDCWSQMGEWNLRITLCDSSQWSINDCGG